MSEKPGFAPRSPSRGEVLDGLTAELEAAGVESPRHEAERLACHALDVARSDLLLHLDTALDPDSARRLGQVAARRLAGVPLQHIEGTVAFRNLILLCDERALIPRPETEQLVDLITQWGMGKGRRPGVVRVRRPASGPAPRDVALDIGTGSGAIALSLVQEGIVRRAVGLDISSPALEQAAENRRLAGLEQHVELRAVAESPWDAVAVGERFDLIVANPPYVRDSELAGLPIEVRGHEPPEALAGGADGLNVVREIAREARAHLRDDGALFLEVGAGQAPASAAVVSEHGPWTSVGAHRDLAGHLRFVVARV